MTNLKKRYPSGTDLEALKASLLAKLGDNADMRCEVDEQGYTCIEVMTKDKDTSRHYRPKKAAKKAVKEPKLFPGEYIPDDGE